MMDRRSLLAAPVFAAVPAFAQKVPRPAGKIDLRDPDGGPLLLSKYAGKPLIVSGMHTTCPSCQQFTQVLNRLHAQYSGRAGIVGVYFEDGAKTRLPNFIARFQPAFPVGTTNQDGLYGWLQLSIMGHYYVPMIAAVDARGTIVEQHTGADNFFRDREGNLKALIERMLAAKS